ncbi:DeoR/GlpR family DNA-binding transcription regulator [Clostridium sp. YIM B02551]|uniref:DeoR/GlpR family DNA-binding transcription regulator n=1 Tax=Clostridium sp. YIM B02551 TaxID=2910679 RepID=UPI001EECD0BB|nr:DeoR/GlpR family DNA-binding transcription regulator [Clostridium sp. YIM B02551]
MFAEERLNAILSILEEQGKVYVKDLSVRFNMSEPMIRKDLQRLEKEGKLKRTYGGAILERKKAESTSIETRLVRNTDKKHIIAKKALNEINDLDMIFLDISSINYLMAKLIAEENKRITVVTNMVEISTLFNENTNTELICIGGRYNKHLGGVVGSAASLDISRYRVDKAFIGSCGVNVLDNSISNFDLEEGNTKKAIIKASKETFIVMENTKFIFDGSYKFAILDDINNIITDELPDMKILDVLMSKDIRVI